MERLLERVAEHGLGDERVARRALHATLSALGCRLDDEHARMLAASLPLELVSSIEDGEYESELSTDELVERVRRRERTTSARARQTTEAVLTALGSCLGHARRRRLARGLPEHAADLVLRSVTSSEGASRRHGSVRATSLRRGPRRHG
jgi:uncharacterized protein (DUF2267 family)